LEEENPRVDVDMEAKAASELVDLPSSENIVKCPNYKGSP
jgi:hypothetical protein